MSGKIRGENIMEKRLREFRAHSLIFLGCRKVNRLLKQWLNSKLRRIKVAIFEVSVVHRLLHYQLLV